MEGWERQALSHALQPWSVSLSTRTKELCKDPKRLDRVVVNSVFAFTDCFINSL